MITSNAGMQNQPGRFIIHFMDLPASTTTLDFRDGLQITRSRLKRDPLIVTMKYVED